jgi:hypothetical protein
MALLIAYGGKAIRPERLAEIVAAAKSGGVELTIDDMEDIAHAFPQSQYLVVRQWLCGPALGLPTTTPSTQPASAAPSQTAGREHF